MKNEKVIAIGKRLQDCRNVITLGLKINFSDYSKEEQKKIISGQTIYYPTFFYADILNSAGIPTFPSYNNYKYAQDKIKQTALFQILKIPHPKTKIFYAFKKSRILEIFQYPFIAKIPRGSAMGRGVYLIKNRDDLEQYLNLTKIAYIQDYLPIKRDIRVVIIGKKAAIAYFRTANDCNFKTNLSAGGEVSFKDIPNDAIRFAENAAKKCGFNDAGIDVIEYKKKYYILEANIKYGKQGFKAAGIDYVRLMEGKIDSGEI
ncbi:MAG: RimK family alpha-L-glutamate ligase [Deltaproteobacteria bacterium]|nr:RimK family alpha-L-glutamate ligase [Deltaproteobacteria bacterium]